MEDSPEQKRKRASNWSEEDKILLKDLIKEKVDVIENKNTDTNTNNKKEKAWSWIEESFNNMCQGSKRTLTQLKSQWIVTKINAKKELSSHRREMNKTGGGPQPPQSVLVENDIAVWLPQEFVVDSNEFDSDGVFEIPPAVTSASPAKSQNEDKDLTIEPEVSTKAKKKTIPVLSTNLGDEKIKEVVRHDIECREELHRLQIINEEKKVEI